MTVNYETVRSEALEKRIVELERQVSLLVEAHNRGATRTPATPPELTSLRTDLAS